MNFEDLIAKVKTCGKQKLAVAAAEDDAVLEAVDAAHKQGIADAILVGDEAAIRKIAAELPERCQQLYYSFIILLSFCQLPFC